MATFVNWITGIISIPRADMTLIQTNPVEIRELDTNILRLNLRDLEDDILGRPWPKTHNHNADVLVGGISLADVLLILEPYTITFEDGLYAVYLQGTNNNILERTNKNQVSVNPNNSAGLVNSTAIERMVFTDRVTIDINSAYSGTIGEVGTLQKPVNNMPDAILIAEYWGFKTFYFLTSMTISGVDITGYILIGASSLYTKIILEVSTICDGITIKTCDIWGASDGTLRIEDCSIGDLTNVNGIAQDSCLYGTIILGGGKDTCFVNCRMRNYTLIPSIDMGGSGQNVFCSNWSGGIKFRNMLGNNSIGLQMDGGKVFLESTISAGFVGIIGTGLKDDLSTGTAIVDTTGLINKSTISSAVWSADLSIYSSGEAGDTVQVLMYGKEVILDTVNGQSGTAFPIGTRAHPSNNLTDTLAICATRNLIRIMLRSNITIEASHNVDNISIETHGILGTNIVFQTGCSANRTTIRYANISGVIANGDLLFVESCSVGNLENFTGIMNVATFGEGCEISLGLWANFINCHCGGEPTNEPEVSIGTASLTVVNYSGNVKFTNKTGTNRAAASFLAGNVSIASSCVLGKIQILGTGEVDKDDSGPNCHVDVDAALTNEYIADHVLDELVAEHVVDGSLSNIVQNIQDGILRTLGLDQENQYTDQTTYTTAGELLTARVRIYSQAISVGTDLDILATYQITATYEGVDMLTYKAVRI